MDYIEQMITILTYAVSMSLPLGLPVKMEDFQPSSTEGSGPSEGGAYVKGHPTVSSASAAAAAPTAMENTEDIDASTAQWTIRSAPSKRRSVY
eukprot:659968-Amphidinium_carterae.3